MSAHTPGPWSLIHRPSGPWTVYKPADSDSERERFYNGEWIHEGENEADARLICAAPDLLEALREILDAEQKREIMPMGWVVRAKEAIAKAAGK